MNVEEMVKQAYKNQGGNFDGILNDGLQKAIMEVGKEMYFKDRYVPGQFRCAKCKLSLTSQTLYMKSGTIGDNNEPQKCSNGCGPMWKITWEQYSKELMESVDNLAGELIKIKNAR